MSRSSQLTIRPFSRKDYPEIIELWRTCHITLKPSDSLSEIEKFCNFTQNRLLVAVLDSHVLTGRLAGTVLCAFDGRRGWVYHLAVRKQERRAGIGTRLMRAAEEHFRKLGAIKVNLLVEHGNEAAGEFYAALGFSPSPLAVFEKEL